MYQPKSILKSKKFQYALFFLAVGTILVFLPGTFHVNSQTEHLLNKLLSADIFIGGLVIGGHSLTDAAAQYASRPQFKELYKALTDILEASGQSEETIQSVTDFLKEAGLDL